MKIKLKNKTVLIDDEDFELIDGYRLSLIRKKNKFYVYIDIDYKTRYPLARDKFILDNNIIHAKLNILTRG